MVKMTQMDYKSHDDNDDFGETKFDEKGLSGPRTPSGGEQRKSHKGY